MGILTIEDGVLEADFDQLIQRWSRDENEVIGTSNNTDCCPIANLLMLEFAPTDVCVNVFQVELWFFERSEVQVLKPSGKLIDFIQLVDDWHCYPISEEDDEDDFDYRQEPVLASIGCEIIKTLQAQAQT